MAGQIRSDLAFILDQIKLADADGHDSGLPQDDILLGTCGDDLVFGFAGTDYIVPRAAPGVSGPDIAASDAVFNVFFADSGDGLLFGDVDDDAGVDGDAVTIADGGQGDDVFVFGAGTSAQDDTIGGFEAGDRLAPDAQAGSAVFTLDSAQASTAPGQLVVSYETRADGEYTIISTEHAGGTAAGFSVSIAGHHVLTVTDFTF